MKLRMNYQEANPEAFEKMMELEQHVRQSGLDPILYHLIKIRVSQINGCAFCVDMHAKELSERGESLERLVLISVWRDAPVFTEAERAALELAECVTRLAEKGVPLDVYERARSHYDERQYVSLIMAVNAINNWNRLSLSTGMYPGCFL